MIVLFRTLVGSKMNEKEAVELAVSFAAEIVVNKAEVLKVVREKYSS